MERVGKASLRRHLANDLKGTRAGATWLSLRRAFQAEGTSTKALRSDHACCGQRTVWRPERLDWREPGKVEEVGARAVTGPRPRRALSAATRTSALSLSEMGAMGIWRRVRT